MIPLLPSTYNQPSPAHKRQASVLFSGDEMEYDSIKPAPQPDQVQISEKVARDEAIKVLKVLIPGSEGKSLHQVRAQLKEQEVDLEKREREAKSALYLTANRAKKALERLERERQALEDAKAACEQWSLLLKTK